MLAFYLIALAMWIYLGIFLNDRRKLRKHYRLVDTEKRMSELIYDHIEHEHRIQVDPNAN